MFCSCRISTDKCLALSLCNSRATCSRWRPPLSWIVEFTKLFADGIWREQTHHCTKFCQNRSSRYGDIAICRIFKVAAAAIMHFWNHEFLITIGSRVARRISVPNFVKIGQSVAKILKFFDFSRWRQPSSWIFRNLKFLFATGICRAQSHHCTNFR